MLVREEMNVEKQREDVNVDSESKMSNQLDEQNDRDEFVLEDFHLNDDNEFYSERGKRKHRLSS